MRSCANTADQDFIAAHDDVTGFPVWGDDREYIPNHNPVNLRPALRPIGGRYAPSNRALACSLASHIKPRPAFVPKIVPGRDRQHIMYAPASASPNNQPLLNHLLQLAVRLAFLHPGQSAVFASRDLPVSLEIFQRPGLAFVQPPAGGFVSERNGDAPLGGRAAEGDDKLVMLFGKDRRPKMAK